MEPSDKPSQKSPFSESIKKKKTEGDSTPTAEQKTETTPEPIKTPIVSENEPNTLQEKDLFEESPIPPSVPTPSPSTIPPIPTTKIEAEIKPKTATALDESSIKIESTASEPEKASQINLPAKKELAPELTPKIEKLEPKTDTMKPITDTISPIVSSPVPPNNESKSMPVEKPSPPFINHNFLLIIPSWQQITGAPLGKYIHNNVSVIHSDPLIFFGGKEVAVETPKGKVYLIFGLGYYYVKFQMADKKYVIDNRLITGLVLSDFVYDLLASSKRNTLEDDPDVLITDKMLKVPWDLSRKTDQKLTFIKGALARELLRFKEIIIEFMEKIKNNALQFQNRGHRILSTHWDAYNSIFYEDQLKRSDASYLLATAGINAMKPGAISHITSLIGNGTLDQIAQCINLFQNTLMSVVYDPMDLYSILLNTVKTIRVQNAMGNVEKFLRTGSSFKHVLLFSADPWRNQMTEWPDSIPRIVQTETIAKAGVQPDIKQLVKEYHKTLDSIQNVDASQLTVSKVDNERESFQFSQFTQSAGAQTSGAAPPPDGDIEAILRYLKDIVNANFDLPTIGNVFDAARENIRKLDKQSKYLWQLNKVSTKYGTKAKGLGLSVKEKEDLNKELDGFIAEVVEAKRLEAERLERERLERERIERERLEAERLEQERLERERLEAERLAKLEEERKEREKQEFIRKKKMEQEELQRQKEEKERQELLAREKQEAELLAKQKAVELAQEKQRLEQTKANAKQEAADRKKREKEEKERKKKEEKLKKEQEKLEKQKKKEEEKRKKAEEKKRKEEEKKQKAAAKGKK